MSDANAVGRLSRELQDAAYRLRDAIAAAYEGHRGIGVDVVETVNEVLRRSVEPVPFRLVHDATTRLTP